MFPERISRVESALQAEISNILPRYQDTISRTAFGALLTITRVVVTKNLEKAIVYYSWLNLPSDADPRRLETALKECASQISRELCKRMALKRFPKLSFQYDASFVGASHVYEILQNLENDQPSKTD